MKKYEFNINSRTQFIEFAQRLGEALQQTPKDSPWILDLNGDGDSGKSLIALGIDSIFRSEIYPEGVTTGLSADEILKPNSGSPIVMNNFRRGVYTSKEGYDKKLSEFQYENQQAKVLIAANLERVYVDKYYSYEKNGLNSDELDLGVQVFTLSPNNHSDNLNTNFNALIKKSSFNRSIVLYTADDCPLVHKLNQMQSSHTTAPEFSLIIT